MTYEFVLASERISKNSLETQVTFFLELASKPLKWPPDRESTPFETWVRSGKLFENSSSVKVSEAMTEMTHTGLPADHVELRLREWLKNPKRLKTLSSRSNFSPDEVYPWDFEYVKNVLFKERAEPAVKLIESIIARDPSGAIHIGDEGRLVLASSELTNKRFDFFKPTLFDYFNTIKAAWIAIVVGLCSFVVVLMSGWILTYPHIGWRRVALVISPLAAISGMVLFRFGEEITETFHSESGLIAFAIVSIPPLVLAPTLLLAGRDIACWISRGFKQPTQ